MSINLSVHDIDKLIMARYVRIKSRNNPNICIMKGCNEKAHVNKRCDWHKKYTPGIELIHNGLCYDMKLSIIEDTIICADEKCNSMRMCPSKFCSKHSKPIKCSKLLCFNRVALPDKYCLKHKDKDDMKYVCGFSHCNRRASVSSYACVVHRCRYPNCHGLAMINMLCPLHLSQVKLDCDSSCNFHEYRSLTHRSVGKKKYDGNPVICMKHTKMTLMRLGIIGKDNCIMNNCKHKTENTFCVVHKCIINGCNNLEEYDKICRECWGKYHICHKCKASCSDDGNQYCQYCRCKHIDKKGKRCTFGEDVLNGISLGYCRLHMCIKINCFKPVSILCSLCDYHANCLYDGCKEECNGRKYCSKHECSQESCHAIICLDKNTRMMSDKCIDHLCAPPSYEKVNTKK